MIQSNVTSTLVLVVAAVALVWLLLLVFNQIPHTVQTVKYLRARSVERQVKRLKEACDKELRVVRQRIMPIFDQWWTETALPQLTVVVAQGTPPKRHPISELSPDLQALVTNQIREQVLGLAFSTASAKIGQHFTMKVAEVMSDDGILEELKMLEEDLDDSYGMLDQIGLDAEAFKEQFAPA